MPNFVSRNSSSAPESSRPGAAPSLVHGSNNLGCAGPSGEPTPLLPYVVVLCLVVLRISGPQGTPSPHVYLVHSYSPSSRSKGIDRSGRRIHRLSRKTIDSNAASRRGERLCPDALSVDRS